MTTLEQAAQERYAQLEERAHQAIQFLQRFNRGAERRKSSDFAIDEKAGEEYYSNLQQRANAAIAGIYNTKITPITFPAQGDFPWFYQNVNQVFNQGTFDYISARVSPGDVEGTAQLTAAGGFPNSYDRVVESIAFTLSTADQATLNKAQENASVQAQSIISTYQGIFGEITQTDMDEAVNALGRYAVANKQDYVIAFVMGFIWSGRQAANKPALSWAQMQKARNLRELLPQMPPSGEPVLSEVTVYLNILGPTVSLQDLLNLGGWIRQQLIHNTTQPDEANGGMKTVDPNTGSVSDRYQVGYGISSSIASIQNDLESSRSFELSMSTSQAQGSSLKVSIDGGGGFSVGSLLKFSLGAQFSYDMTEVKGASQDTSVSVKYEGFTMVPTAPTAWQQATNVGWFYGDPIAEAQNNSGRDVTGFKFVSPPPFDMGPFATGGNFGQIQNLLISKYPTITIHFRQANFEEFQQSFQQEISGNLTLFGFIKLGSFNEGTYFSSFERGASNSEFTVTFQASEQVLSVPDLQKTAFVIGGSFDFPGADLDRSLVHRHLGSL